MWDLEGVMHAHDVGEGACLAMQVLENPQLCAGPRRSRQELDGEVLPSCGVNSERLGIRSWTRNGDVPRGGILGQPGPVVQPAQQRVAVVDIEEINDSLLARVPLVEVNSLCSTRSRVARVAGRGGNCWNRRRVWRIEWSTGPNSIPALGRQNLMPQINHHRLHRGCLFPEGSHWGDGSGNADSGLMFSADWL